MAPAFILGAGGGDLQCQSLWVKHFSQQFWQGDLYPRWLSEMYAGSGSPVFYYYPPLAYYVTALFAFMADWGAFSFYPIAAAGYLAVTASGWAFYYWLREEVDAKAALFGSLLYIALPFHTAHIFHVMLLYSTMWAYAWVPLLLLFAKKLAQGKAYGFSGFALTLGLLIITNIPSTILFGPIAVFYGVLHRSTGWPVHLKRFIPAIALGFGLSTFYLAPALAYMDYAIVDLHWHNSGNDFTNKLLNFDFDDASMIQALIVWLAGLILTVAYFRASAPYSKERWFWCILTVAALLLFLPIMAPLWQIKLLSILQHPVRLYAIAAVAISLFAALSYNPFPTRNWLLLALFTGITLYAPMNNRLTPELFEQIAPKTYKRYHLAIDQYANYLPKPSLIPRYYTEEGVARIEADQAPVTLITGKATFEVQKWQARHIRMQVHSANTSVLKIRQFYFPTFQLSVDGVLQPLGRDMTTGHMLVNLPAGEHLIDIAIAPLLIEILGKLLSFISLAMIVLYELLRLRTSQRTPTL
ncbi:MAG: hypothetical protein SFT92_04550 [Rickettsiales bacterium]|nr:hypothetical protein [Rickettsiales bacterium]